MSRGNLLVAQSGGPTVAINATMAGVIRQGLSASDKVEKVLGSLNGVEGMINNKIIDITSQIKDEETIRLLERTPAMALGSCRKKLPVSFDDPAYSKILAVLKKHNVTSIVYIGGNDSMDTVKKLSEYFLTKGENINIIGAPKTIDNDLPITDHTPGFGSAAKYIATSVLEVARDSEIYAAPSITIVEIMGRNAGWLTAAAALPRALGEKAPHLVYLPEVPFTFEKFTFDAKAALAKYTNVIVAVSEGVKTPDGKYASEIAQSGVVDAFGHKYLSGIGKVLENYVRDNIGCKVRSIELNVLQRSASHIASATDLAESSSIGQYAARMAISGETGKTAVFCRDCGGVYNCSVNLADVTKIANLEKLIPAEWISPEGNMVKDEAIAYILPLIQGEVSVSYANGLPVHFKFDKNARV